MSHLQAGHSYPRLPFDEGKKQIRLLHLAPELHTAQLRGTLEVVALSDQPHYEALSYTWGAYAAQDRPKIVLNGSHAVELTENLTRALRRLRHRFRHRVLWIDQLCINQSDNAERGRQVSMMSDIYRAADCICIWLGDIDSLSLTRRFLTSVTSISTVQEQWHFLKPQPSSDHHRPKLWERLYFLTMIKPTAKAIEAAICQSRPQWHTRCWVYQEVNSARAHTWCFGPFEQTATPDALDQFLSDAKSCFGKDQMRDIDMNLSGLTKPWRKRDRGGRSVRLLDNLEAISAMQTKDPRDRVYSVVSVTRAEEAEMIKVDYDNTIGEVFAEATYASIAVFGGLRTLWSADCNANSALGLPSWAIDFTIPNTFPMAERIVPDLYMPQPLSDSGHSPRMCDSAVRLCLSGVLFDQVSMASPALPTLAIHEQLSADSALFRLLEDAPKGAEGGVQTETCTAYGLRIAARRRETMDFGNILSVIVKDITASQKDGNRYRYEVVSNPTRNDLLSAFSLKLLDSAESGSLYVTSSGLTGLTSASVSRGDVIAMVDNYCWPIVVRPEGEHYLFRGFTFIGGLMNARELLEDFWRRNDVCLRDIILV